MSVELNLATDNKKGGSSDLKKFLSFIVGKLEYAVDIMMVREIKVWTEVTRLPNSPEEMRGVMNLRGVIIPIFDLRTRFGQGTTEATNKNVVIILSAGNRIIGILVDAVSDILDVEATEIKASPTSETEIDDKYISGLVSINERMVIVLNMEEMFGQINIENIKQ